MAERDDDDVAVRAAGGVVLRDGPEGPEVAIVHRPRYDDWSLPKGKLDGGEQWDECALREVEEETGLRCVLGDELEPVRYRDRKQRPKLVRFWSMRALDPTSEFSANDEVDELRWLSLESAAELLDYPHDRELITALAQGATTTNAAQSSGSRPP
jgi:8-oxo-dGTP diphosphatase